MPITLDDFKEGGSLRNFVTQVGLLGKIGKDGVNQEELLSTLINSVTMVGAYTDSNEDGAITTADSVSDKFSNKEDESAEGDDGESKIPEGSNNDGENTVVGNNDEEGGSAGTNEQEEETEPEDEQEDIDSPSVDPTDGE
jgi:hypothetical protein